MGYCLAAIQFQIKLHCYNVASVDTNDFNVIKENRYMVQYQMVDNIQVSDHCLTEDTMDIKDFAPCPYAFIHLKE